MNNLPSLLQNKYVVIIGGVVIFLLLGLVILFSSSNSNTQSKTGNSNKNGQSDQTGYAGGTGQSGSNQPSTNPVHPSGTAVQPTKTASADEYPIPAYQNNYVINFKNSAYAKYAYQVFPGPISAEAKKQLGTFTISSLKYPDGHAVVTLHFNQTGYEDVQVTANPDETIYYVRLPNYEDPGDVGLIRVGTDGNISTQ